MSGISLSARLDAVKTDELNPQQVIRSLVAGASNYLLEVMVVVSFAVLIFSGKLSSHVSRGITLMLIADALLVGLTALLSSYPGSVSIIQDAPVAITATAVAGLMVAATRSTPPDVLYATVLMLIIVTTLTCGLFFLALGILKLGGLARFLPFPVIGGFLAATGWLIVAGGLSTMSSVPLGLELLRPEAAVHWLPGLALGVVLLIAATRIANPIVLPVVMALAAVIFYVVAWLTGASIEQLRAGGWLVSVPQGSTWQLALTPELLRQVDWPLLTSRLGSVAAVPVVAAISLLLNANAIELLVRRDIDLNHELIATGLGNLAAGFVGGVAGYHAVSLTGLNQAMSGGKRLAGLTTAALLGVTLLAGTAFLSFVPRFLLGGLLVFLGLALLYEWVVRAWSRFARVDFLIILLILGVIVWRGFLVGLGAGLAATTIVFVVGYSRVGVARHERSGAQVRSRVNRGQVEQAVLQAHASEMYVLELQGFIFFGTANALYEKVRERMAEETVRCVLIDFSRVIGLDSTGMRSFEKLRQSCQEHEVQLVLTGAARGGQRWASIAEQFARAAFTEQPGLVHFADNLDRGIEWYEERVLAAEGIHGDASAGLEEELASLIPPGELAALLQYMERRECAAGERLFSQGDPSDCLFLVDWGQVSAVVEQPGREPIRLETMRAGRTVGELGFYLGTQRSAAVIADKDSRVYVLSHDALTRMKADDPRLAAELHRVIAHLLSQRVLHLMSVVDGLQH